VACLGLWSQPWAPAHDIGHCTG